MGARSGQKRQAVTKIRLSLTPREHRLVMRALCLALADSMSAIHADTLTWPSNDWKELLDIVTRAADGAKEKGRRDDPSGPADAAVDDR